MSRITSIERRVITFSLVCLILTSYTWLSHDHSTSLAQPITSTVTTSSATPAAAATFSYYGADLNLLQQATGVDPNNPFLRPTNAPWPQFAHNYCPLALVQAVANYTDLVAGLPMSYPHQSDQGPPATKELSSRPQNPDDPSLSGDINPQGQQPKQILTQMDTRVPAVDVLPNPPIKNIVEPDVSTGLFEVTRTPFLLANISHDYGGDPRAQAMGAGALSASTSTASFYWYQHIYHNGVDAASHALAAAVNTPGPNGKNLPAFAFVDGAYHVVLVAGVYADSNPATNPNATISNFVVFNPWDQNWLSYLGTYYNKIPYADWTGASGYPHWWGQSYNPHGDQDPDPYIGPYAVAGQATHLAPTFNPDAPAYEAGVDPIAGPIGPPSTLKLHHWINNYVTIQGTGSYLQGLTPQRGYDADSAFDEYNSLMLWP